MQCDSRQGVCRNAVVKSSIKVKINIFVSRFLHFRTAAPVLLLFKSCLRCMYSFERWALLPARLCAFCVKTRAEQRCAGVYVIYRFNGSPLTRVFSVGNTAENGVWVVRLLLYTTRQAICFWEMHRLPRRKKTPESFLREKSGGCKICKRFQNTAFAVLVITHY